MSGFRTAECNGILCFVFGLGMIADRLWIFLFCTATIAFAQTIEIEYEEAGLFPKKEHSLAIPYQGLGMTMPYWNIFGSTVASVSYIRLTHDSQSLRGGISNTVPLAFPNWEVLMQFKIHGKSEKWYGDGLAFWYLTDMLKPGPIFGAADYFNGLAVFIDTYANQNNVYNHAYPYISVMINNRTIHHDYETDGFHSVIKGCEAKVRDSKHDTHLLIRYDNDELMVKINIGGEWQECLNLRGVLLPTRGHIGVSASTGDLTDNHDIISLKVYELEVKPGQRIEDRDSITPTFLYHSVILQETDTKKLSNFSLFLITFFTIISIIFLAALFYLYWQMKLERDAKRFY